MSPFADLQRCFARAVLDGDAASPGLPALVGRIAPAAALRVHQGTVLGGLTNALRLTFPTVDALVGPDFFDHAALAFIEAEPPAMADLSAYGEGYPAFLGRFAPAQDLPYLADVARLDQAIDRAHRAQHGEPRRVRLDAAVAMDLAPTLTVMRSIYPVDAIRALISAGDADALAGLDMAPRLRRIAIWRSDDGARVRPLGPAAGAFLEAILKDAALDAALDAANGETAADAALAEIQAEVFRASFTTIIPIAES